MSINNSDEIPHSAISEIHTKKKYCVLTTNCHFSSKWKWNIQYIKTCFEWPKPKIKDNGPTDALSTSLPWH